MHTKDNGMTFRGGRVHLYVRKPDYPEPKRIFKPEPLWMKQQRNKRYKGR